MNSETIDQADVSIKAMLVSGIEYISSSSRLSNNNLDHKQINDDVIKANGVNIGSYAGGSGWATLEFKVNTRGSLKKSESFIIVVSTDDGNKHVTAWLE